MKLREMISPEEEEISTTLVNNPNKGSVFDPGDIGSGDIIKLHSLEKLFVIIISWTLEESKKKEIAKPYAKIEAKVGTKEFEEQKKQKKNEIWAENEIQEIPISKNDSRPRPEFEVFNETFVNYELKKRYCLNKKLAQKMYF